MAIRGQGDYRGGMPTYNVGAAKDHLSELIAAVEAGEEVEIARNGVPVVRLMAITSAKPGERFLAACGSVPEIEIGEDFEFTPHEIDEMYAS